MPTTLHKFTLLPPELRNIIWESSLPNARVFDIYPASNHRKTSAQQGLRFANLYSEPPPALAAVCRESRSLALHYYQPMTLCGTTKYVDLSRDVLMLESCLSGRDLLRTLHFMETIPLIRDNLRCLAFGTSYGVHTGVWHPVLGWRKLTQNNMGKFLQRLGGFPMLEKLVFMVHQEIQLKVVSMPPGKELVARTGSAERTADMMRNATVYPTASTPPPPKMLPGRRDSNSAASQTTTPVASSFSWLSPRGDAETRGFCDLPRAQENPWLPHANEISYYPPADDGSDDGSADCARKSEEVQELWSLVATTDDWLKFRRTFKRYLETGLQLGLADPTTKKGCCKKRRRVVAQADDEDLRSSKRARGSAASRGEFKLPAIEGASLVWRYSRPS